MTTRKMDLGTFDVISGKLTVSDPCYKPGTWCMGELTNVLPGTWNASAVLFDAGEWGERVARLIIHHENHPHTKGLDVQEASIEVGVDSGQAGFFDSAHYQDDTSVPEGDETYGSLWYSHCCNITLSRTQSGVMPYGVVSSSGFGDGGYDCHYWATAAGHIVKAEIVFITQAEMKEWADE